MIDPKALQQHFRKVQQNEKPFKLKVSRIPDLAPLTAVQAISIPVEEKLPIPEIILKQKEVIIPAQTKLKEVEPEQIKEPVNLVINADPPIDAIIINEIEEDVEPKKDDVYDPYGYYSGPQY